MLILWATLFERGYSSQRWLTYRQAQALGANVRKGETGTTVCYADRFTSRDDDSGQLPLGDGDERWQVAFLKRFTVFNVDQCEGLKWLISAAALLALGVSAAEAKHRAAPHVSVLVVNADTGATLYADAPGKVRAPASLTKMMTMFLAFEAMRSGQITPTSAISISHEATRQPPSRLGISAGRSLSARSALRVIAVDSANDVTVALAEALAGSERRFVRKMNATAQQLGMRDSHFANATGLKNPGNRSTARDMATLSLALIRRYPEFYSYFSTRKLTWKTRTMLNHNHLLGKVPGVDGIKTGYTVDAGYNLAASAKRHGKRIVVIMLGARTSAARDARVANLIELGFAPPPAPRAGPRARLRR